jgi:2'-5' RNA ligase
VRGIFTEILWIAPVRLFIATSLAPDIRHKIDSLLQKLSTSIGREQVKWVNVSGMHVTMKFLGETPADEVVLIRGSMDQIASLHSPIQITIENLGCYPNKRKPRVIWVGIREDSGALEALHSQLEQGMQELGFPKEKRRFHPHLTLGRVRRQITGAVLKDLADRIKRIPDPIIGQQYIENLSLIKSEPKPNGPVYTHLHTSTLGGGE